MCWRGRLLDARHQQHGQEHDHKKGRRLSRHSASRRLDSDCRSCLFVVMLLTVLLVRGIQESARANNIMVLIKIAAILVFVFAAASFIKPHYWHPFLPNGWTGVLTGGSIIFFTYIGFDSVSTAAEECKNPQRDLPIVFSPRLPPARCSYARWPSCSAASFLAIVMGDAAPVVNALKRSPLPAARTGMVRLFVLIRCPVGHDLFDPGLPARPGARLVRHVSRRAAAGHLRAHHAQFRTPAVATWVAGLSSAFPPACWTSAPSQSLQHRHLFAFVVGLDRRTRAALSRAEPLPRLPRPAGPLFPVLSIVFCIVLMMGWRSSPGSASSPGWSLAGDLLLYSRHRSEFARQR